MSFRRLRMVIFAVLFAASPFAFAKKGGEAMHLLSNAAGQVDASFSAPTANANQNAAGLAYNNRMKILGGIGSGNDDFDPLSFNGQFVYAGKGSFAAGAGAAFSTADGSSAVVNANIANTFGDAVAVGASGFFNFDAGTNIINAGAIFMPRRRFRVGITATAIGEAAAAYGAGVGFDVGKGFTISGDFTADDGFDAKVVTPGLRYAGKRVSATLGYGILLDSGSNIGQPAEPEDLTAGLGFWISQNLYLKLHYKHKNTRYYAGLGWAFGK